MEHPVLRRTIERWKPHKWFLGYLALYLIGNLLFLTDFPFVHSDEAWLSGLSRNMLETGHLGVTETFFDLKPRNPHAIKSLYHLLQMPFLLLFGYRVFSFRLLSMLSALPALWLCYRLGERLTHNRFLGAAAAIALSLDVQFIYAAHFARQEMLILLLMLAVIAQLLSGHRHAYLCAGVLTGLSVGIHPNSFLVAAAGAATCVAIWLYRRRVQWRGLLLYAGITAAFTAFFVALSLSFDPNFFRNYLAYGSEFQVSAPLGAKILETGPYFQRLYYQVSGTYYTPNIRLQLTLFPFLLATGVLACLHTRVRKKRWDSLIFPLAAVAGIWAGMAIVGRWSQPYVLFFFPFCYFAAALLLTRLRNRLATIGAVTLCAVVAVCSVVAIAPALQTQRGAYDRYLAEIASVVPAGAKTIGNLNAEYHFENGALLDYRNLTYLKQKNSTLAEYLEKNEVEFLIISDELYLLHELRPTWNGVYGNINYLEQMEDITAEWEEVHSFTDNFYGVRLVRYQNSERDFSVRIYQNPVRY